MENKVITGAIESRRAMRAFLPTPVARETVERILEVAARAPSGSNIQPWHVDVISGAKLKELSSAITARFDAGDYGEEEYQYYPEPWREPYLSRRRKIGWGLYGLLGIERHEKDRMAAQLRRNYLFFDAPIGMIFSMERNMATGTWLDYGMFLENVMIAARAFGLHTCPQQAFSAYHEEIRTVLRVPEDRLIVCGMSLGEADLTDVANSLETERVPVSEFAAFHE